MVHQRLSDLMQGGAAFVVEQMPADGETAMTVEPGWPVALVSTAGVTLFSPEHDDTPSPGDLVVRLYQPALAPAPAAVRRRRFGLPSRRVAA